MKLNKKTTARSGLKIAGAACLTLVTSLALAAAQEIVRYEAQPSASTCTITGSSSMGHDWTMTSSIITGYIEADANFPHSVLTNSAATSPKVVANFPVRAFKSGKQAMDDRMQDSVEANKFGRFEYRLLSLKPKSKPDATGPLEFEATGALTIIGNTVTNTIPVTIEAKDGKLKVVGNTSLNMSDYKMKAPTFSVLGATIARVGDELKIKFEWTLAPKKKAP